MFSVGGPELRRRVVERVEAERWLGGQGVS